MALKGRRQKLDLLCFIFFLFFDRKKGDKRKSDDKMEMRMENCHKNKIISKDQGKDRSMRT